MTVLPKYKKGEKVMMWRHIYLSAIIVLGSVSPVFAKIEVKDDIDSDFIIAHGHMNGYEESNIISIDVKNNNGETVHTSYIPSNDGNFEYAFKLPDVTEEYVCTFSSYFDKEEVLYTSISTTDASNIVGLINGVEIDENSNTDEQNVVDIIESSLNAFSLDSYFWNEVYDAEQKKCVAAAILKNRGTGYQSLNEIRNIAKEEYAIRSFASCKTAEDVGVAINAFDDLYKIGENTSKFSEFDKLTDSKKEILNTIVSNEIKNTTSIETFKDIYELVDRGMLLALINNSTDPASIKKLIDNNRDCMTFSMTTYDSGNKDAVCAYLFGKEIYSMSDLEQMIIKAVENTKKPIISQGSGSGGSGGGKSSSASNIPNYPTSQASIKVKPIFDDIDDVEWAQDAILYLANKKIINGIGDNKFAPNDNVTREQFVQMLVNAFNIEGECEVSFEDISKEHWAYKSISIAVGNNIVNGISDSMFGIGKNITRQDMAVMTQRVIDQKGYNLDSKNTTGFTDADDIADYAKESVKLLSEAGIINGFEDKTFRPQGLATRAQAAAIIYTILQEVE